MIHPIHQIIKKTQKAPNSARYSRNNLFETNSKEEPLTIPEKMEVKYQPLESSRINNLTIPKELPVPLQEYFFDNKKETEFERINNIDFDRLSNISNSYVEEEDKDIIEKRYVKNPDSFRFNNILRTLGPNGLDINDFELFNALTNAINSYKTPQNFLVYRYVDNKYLENVFNFMPNGVYYNLSMIKKQIGSIKIEKGFMSCFMTDKHYIEREIKLKIKIPKGINAYITTNKDESEIILPNNTKYKILDANIIRECIKNKFCNVIQIEVIILKTNTSQDDWRNRTIPLRYEDFSENINKDYNKDFTDYNESFNKDLDETINTK